MFFFSSSFRSFVRSFVINQFGPASCPDYRVDTFYFDQYTRLGFVVGYLMFNIDRIDTVRLSECT